MTEAELQAVREASAKYGGNESFTSASWGMVDALLDHVDMQDRELFDARFQRDSARLSLKQVDGAYDAQAAEVARLRDEAEALRLLCMAYRLGNQRMADRALTKLAALAQEVGRGE